MRSGSTGNSFRKAARRTSESASDGASGRSLASLPVPVPARERKLSNSRISFRDEFGPATEAEIARLIALGAADQLNFKIVEIQVRRKTLQLAARPVTRRLDADRSDWGRPRTCPCGHGFLFCEQALGMARRSLSHAPLGGWPVVALT